MKSFALLLMGGAVCLAQSTVLLYDHNIPQVAFAAAEIRKACASGGRSLVEQGLDALSKNASPLRLVIASDRVHAKQVSDALGIAGIKGESAQSYSIRRQAKDG